MKYEWKKQEKEFYGAKKSPALVTVPAQNYIMIGGKGNPNDVDFSNRVSALYSLAYAIKMAYKTTAIQNEFNDFTVFPLEGIWQKIEETVLVKENLGYTIMIRQPDFICEDIVKAALEQVKVKKPNPLFDEISFGTMNDGKCVEILHIGAFDDEPISFEKMEKFMLVNNLERTNNYHREIYLNNANRIEISKIKTILRYSVS
jgi:hypothetical protein